MAMAVPSEPAFSHPVSEQRLGQEGQAGMRGWEGQGWAWGGICLTVLGVV